MIETLEKLEKFIEECPLLDLKIVNELPNNEEACTSTVYLVYRTENNIDIFDEYIFSNNNGFIKIDSYEMTCEDNEQDKESKMSTRCRIAVKDDDTFRSIYCHYDGYPKYVGNILLNHYNSGELANKLIDLGDISCLLSTLKETEEQSYHIKEQRARRIIEFETLKDMIDYFIQSDQEYLYLWDEDKWKILDKINMKEKLEDLLEDN